MDWKTDDCWVERYSEMIAGRSPMANRQRNRQGDQMGLVGVLEFGVDFGLDTKV